MYYNTDIKRAFFSGRFLVAVLAMAVVVIIGGISAIKDLSGGDTDLIMGATARALLITMASDMALLAAPILCALPFTVAFIDDNKSKYIRLYLPRTGKKGYILSKLLATGLSGGVALLSGILFACVLLAVIYISKEIIPFSDTGQPAASFTGDVFPRAILFFASGAFWSLTGQLLATATMSRYMAYASPFISCYILIILCERYMKSAQVLNPKEWLSTGLLGGLWGTLGFMAVMILGISVAFYFLAQRRLSDA